MVKISVIMSTYNETLEEIEEAIESILNQSFKCFEFIIVNDNPNRKELETYLNRVKELDRRIKLVKNTQNMGLACSLNKAAFLSSSKYLVRMDADDISVTHRLETQYNIMKEHDYDLICTNYSFIDEYGQILERDVKYYTSEEIKTRLPIGNVIHHPTVMLKKESFLKVGGYRNFLAAQDYDLWLRFLERDYSFYMIEEKLLKYRLRQNSISLGKRYLQQCTTIYIRNLYLDRLKGGVDKYTYESYMNFLESKKYKDTLLNKKTNKHYELLVKSHKYYLKGNYFKGLILRIKVFLTSNIYRENYISKLKIWMLIKLKNLLLV